MTCRFTNTVSMGIGNTSALLLVGGGSVCDGGGGGLMWCNCGGDGLVAILYLVAKVRIWVFVGGDGGYSYGWSAERLAEGTVRLSKF